MGRSREEAGLFSVVSLGLLRWLKRARFAVMAPWERYKIQPDPVAIFATQPDWNREVDTILTRIGLIAMRAWSEASDVPPVSRHSFVMSQLAQTENFLVRIPDETYNLIFSVITDVINGGGNTQAVAEAVDNVLTWTGSGNWPHRARVIAITETTRAYGAGTLAAGMEQSRVTGKLLRKKWINEHDGRVRATHKAVSSDPIPLAAMFQVGDVLMLHPGDPLAPVDEVAGCRCDLLIVD